jgi:5-methylcytosine-specific restriction endonuclease McrA
VSAAELLDYVECAGWIVELDSEDLRCRLPKEAAHFAELLRRHKQELVTMIRARGGRIATFPHCPRCASYALYRRNNVGNYECQSCGLPDIAEVLVRRKQINVQ